MWQWGLLPTHGDELTTVAWSIRYQGDVNLAEVREGLGLEDLGARTARRDSSSHVDI